MTIREEDKASTVFLTCGNVSFGLTSGASCVQMVIDQTTAAGTPSASFTYLCSIAICSEGEEQHQRKHLRFYTTAEKYTSTLNDS